MLIVVASFHHKYINIPAHRRIGIIGVLTSKFGWSRCCSVRNPIQAKKATTIAQCTVVLFCQWVNINCLSSNWSLSSCAIPNHLTLLCFFAFTSPSTCGFGGSRRIRLGGLWRRRIRRGRGRRFCCGPCRTRGGGVLLRAFCLCCA